MLLIDKRTVADLLNVQDAIRAVETAFVSHARGETVMPPKVYLPLPKYGGDFRAMPAYVNGAAGLKWVNVHPRNPGEHGLPTVMGVIIYNDPATGEPLAVIDGTLITSWRTAAASALATRVLARPDASTLGVIGCGAQAEPQIVAISTQRPLADIRLYDSRPDRVASLTERLRKLPVRAASIEDTAAADIVVTLTPSRSPIVRREWLRPGSHVNAIGADAPGKQEIDPEVLCRARVFVDEVEQSIHAGELNVPIAEGRFHAEQIAGTLGQILAGSVKGRTHADEITVFDSTGLAIQDIACARVVYDAAKAKGRGTSVDIG